MVLVDALLLDLSGSDILLLIIDILHDLRNQNLRNYAGIVYMGSCRIYISSQDAPYALGSVGLHARR